MSGIVIGRETHYVPPRRCPDCGAQFNTWTGYARHMRIAARVERCMPVGTRCGAPPCPRENLSGDWEDAGWT